MRGAECGLRPSSYAQTEPTAADALLVRILHHGIVLLDDLVNCIGGDADVDSNTQDLRNRDSTAPSSRGPQRPGKLGHQGRVRLPSRVSPPHGQQLTYISWRRPPGRAFTSPG